MLFHGVAMRLAGPGFVGYLSLACEVLFEQRHPTLANIGVGLVAEVGDNVPVMLAVSSMNPPMGEIQWLLLTLTAGIGGKLLAVRSAVGIGLMGQTRENFALFGILKRTPVMSFGTLAVVRTHLPIRE